MEVAVDGIIYQQQARGGISRIFSEILPRMCAIDSALQITMFTSGYLRQPVPDHPHINHHRLFPIELILRPSRIWRPVAAHMRAVMLRQSLGDGRGKTWHSTYYTRLKHWRGKEIVTVYDMIHERFPEFFHEPGDGEFRRQKQDCVSNADAVVCISATTRQDLYELYGTDLTKIYVVPNAPSPVFGRLSSEASINPLPTPKPFLLYVGQRYTYKNFSGLLNGYCMWTQCNDVDLIVVGEPWAKDERCTLAEMGISDRVHLMTGLTDNGLARLFNLAMAFVYPSLYEGFGIPILEAMACGCPVIASRIPSTVEIASEIPLYFEPAAVGSLLAALDTAYTEGRDSQRVRLGLEHVKRFSWDRTARETLEVYRALSNAG